MTISLVQYSGKFIEKIACIVVSFNNEIYEQGVIHRIVLANGIYSFL